MGSAAKAIKKVTKSIKKPFSKITKGIAKGIMKVGKATMRGVAKISNKLGPIGMIAMAMAMPYASGLIGGAWSPAGTTGLLGSQNVFLRSIGTVGNAIRTGYQGVTGFVKAGTKGITRSITEGFSNMGKGNNLWSKVSDGAKTLFNKSRAAVRGLKPITSKGGSVDVSGWGNPFGYAQSTTMTSGQAGSLLDANLLSGDKLSNQVFSKSGWLTKANPMDKAVSEAINSTYKENVLKYYDSGAKRAFNDYISQADAGGQKYNYQNIDTMMKDNLINNSSAPTGTSYGFDFDKSGDYGIGTTQPGQATEYTFNGNKTFKTNNGKSTLAKKATKAIKSKAYNRINNRFNDTNCCKLI